MEVGAWEEAVLSNILRAVRSTLTHSDRVVEMMVKVGHGHTRGQMGSEVDLGPVSLHLICLVVVSRVVSQVTVESSSTSVVHLKVKSHRVGRNQE